ncbi:hypothetical protein [Mycobacterium bourgelatii]|uniref:Gluconolactonase n=1 Tax=Mycobacterium bourgelatii TaxID=1273442 RepID=A0A7I9YYS9_MYCBU|nr:hypothetical protein [Mycobacterium bourgelatii]GFG93677.1 hypothetical protein MBOU_57190 [Mycobacterium bourgelatii]
MNAVDIAPWPFCEPFCDGIAYGEGPRWHGGRLWFTDGLAGRVYSADENGLLAVEAEVERASGLGWLGDGTLVVSALFAAKIYRVDVPTAARCTWWSTTPPRKPCYEVNQPGGSCRPGSTCPVRDRPNSKRKTPA